MKSEEEGWWIVEDEQGRSETREKKKHFIWSPLTSHEEKLVLIAVFHPHLFLSLIPSKHSSTLFPTPLLPRLAVVWHHGSEKPASFIQ